MALIAPIAGAVAGGILTGGAGWAMSAGWLIGSWLFQKKNDDANNVLDPGAEEMPRFNQALRGVTIPILFGTNRVSSQIVWQKNFTTIRKESSDSAGGGKGGGSGMGSKGGGPTSGGTTYEYKWDLLMHLGMGDDDFSLFGGWLGAERLNDDTLLSIINNNQSFGFVTSLFKSDVNRPQNAALSFEEGFFHGNLATGSTLAENWDHFETQEGAGFRFPYTTYIGFKQLNLGGHAIVPQLSWEVGPGGINFSFNSSHMVDYSSAFAVAQAATGPAAGVIKGDDNKIYHVETDGGVTILKVYNVTDNVAVDTLTAVEFDADCTAAGLDPTASFDFVDSTFSGVVPNKNYILVGGVDVQAFSRFAFLLYKINAAGVLEVVGGYQGRGSTLHRINSQVVIGIFGQGTDSDPILLMGSSQVGAQQQYWIHRLPTINEFIAITLETSGTPFDDRQFSLRDNNTEIQSNFGQQSSYRSYLTDSMGVFLPTLTLIGGLPVWGTKVFFYIGKSDIEWHIDNPASANGTDTIYDITGTHPNGGLFSIDIQLANVRELTCDANWTDETNSWLDDSTQLNALPFADSGKLYDEVTIADRDDYDPKPQAQLLTSGIAEGSTLIVFWKNLGDGSSDRGSTGASTRAQVFIWNPLTKKAKRYGQIEGAYVDIVSDWGATSSSASYTTRGISGYFDVDASKIYIASGISGGGGSGLSEFVSVDTFGDFTIGGGDDLLPPYIIYKILTSTVYGFGIDPDTIDLDSYEIALAYCDSEDIRVSVQYRREESKLAAINDLLALYGGFIIDSGGSIKFGLQKFTSSPVRTIDNNHLLVSGEEAPVTVTRGARQDTFNRVKVNYFDRNLEYRQNFIEIGDEVDQDINGVRAQEFPAKFVMQEGVATKLAIRALWSNLYARDIYAFKLGPKDSDLEPGDVITLVDSFHPNLSSGKQVRITEWVEREPLIFSVQGVDEVQYVAESELAINSQQIATQKTLFGPALPAANFTMYELPYEFQGADAKVFVGYRQQSPSKGARLYTSADGVSFAQAQQVEPFIISGILADQLPTRDPGYVEENVEVYLMPDTYSGGWSPSSMTWAQTFQLDDVGPNGRTLGAGLMFVNSEMMAYEGVNLVGQNHYRFDYLYRGWGGTHIQGHSSGDSWHKHGGGIFVQAINENMIGSIIHYKVAPYNFAGVEYNISSVDARTYQIQGTFFRPQNGSRVKTFVQSPGSFLTVQSEDLGIISKKQSITGGTPVQFEWEETARARGYGSRGYGTGGYGRFESDTNSVQWRVEVLSSDLVTVVRCTTVSTTAYLYDVDTNSADFNGWAGSFLVKVTPFNEFGDALRTRTKVLELFE